MCWCLTYERGKGWSLLAIMERDMAWEWFMRKPYARRAVRVS